MHVHLEITSWFKLCDTNDADRHLFFWSKSFNTVSKPQNKKITESEAVNPFRFSPFQKKLLEKWVQLLLLGHSRMDVTRIDFNECIMDASWIEIHDPKEVQNSSMIYVYESAETRLTIFSNSIDVADIINRCYHALLSLIQLMSMSHPCLFMFENLYPWNINDYGWYTMSGHPRERLKMHKLLSELLIFSMISRMISRHLSTLKVSSPGRTFIKCIVVKLYSRWTTRLKNESLLYDNLDKKPDFDTKTFWPQSIFSPNDFAHSPNSFIAKYKNYT